MHKSIQMNYVLVEWIVWNVADWKKVMAPHCWQQTQTQIYLFLKKNGNVNGREIKICSIDLCAV